LNLPRSKDLLRFGAFELDLRARDLRKDGRSIGLPEQSVVILDMLLGRPGELILREDIRSRLWPNDTVVEFDHSINTAVRKLRLALGESADKPQSSCPRPPTASQRRDFDSPSGRDASVATSM
jgi:DNA-binding winged helix-turn-helix (wHTH) protein